MYFPNCQTFALKITNAYPSADSYPCLARASLIGPLRFLRQAASLLIDWCCRSTAFSATWLTQETDLIRKDRQATMKEIICRSTRKSLIHLHPKHCWPPSPDRCWSGQSSRSLCLTGNQSACAWGLTTCRPSSCPYLDLQTDTRLNFGSSFFRIV